MILIPLLYLTVACTTKPEPFTAETALEPYPRNEDGSYSFLVNESYSLDGLEVYDLTFTSQQWCEYTWKHNDTNDEYWPVDTISHYLDEIPGENYIHYVPNAGHRLGVYC